MEPLDYLVAVRRRAIQVVAFAVLGALVGLALSLSTTPVYQATSKLFVGVSGGTSAGDLAQGSTFSQNLVQSYAQLVTQPIVLEPVIEDLGLQTTPNALASRVSADAPLDTVIIEVRVRGGEPRETAAIANAISAEVPRAVESLNPSSADETAVSVSTIAAATPPGAPIEPNLRLRVLSGLLGGGLVGIVVAVGRHLLDNKVREREDVELLTDAPVLASVPQARRSARHVSTGLDPGSARAEAYRRLRTNLQFVGLARSVSVIVVTSSSAGEGKTTTAASLAQSLAEQDAKVLLIDADLRRPRVAEMCGLEGAVGLTTVLLEQADVGDVVQGWGEEHRVDVLASGPIPPNSLQILSSPAMAKLLTVLRQRYEHIVIDSAPLLPVSDAAVLGRIADGAVMTIASGRTRRRDLRSAMDALEVAEVPVLGVVLNWVRLTPDHYYSAVGPARKPFWRSPVQAARSLLGTDA